MTDLKAKLDEELISINLDLSEEEIIWKANRSTHRNHVVPSLVAAILVLVILAGIFVIPELIPKSAEEPRSFAVYAGAAEISDEKFAVINGDDTNFVHFDFNRYLDFNAAPTDITKSYIFHSFEKSFDLQIKGEDIDGFVCFANNCFLARYQSSEDGDFVSFDYTWQDEHGRYKNLLPFPYYDQKDWTFTINPVGPTNNSIRNDLGLTGLTPYIALPETGEIITDENFKRYWPNRVHVDAESLGYKPIAYGVKNLDEPTATGEEIDALRKFAEADDMVGFYNYQNKIFKRLLENASVDILIRKNDQSRYYYEGVTLQFSYVPSEVTAKNLDNLIYNQSETLSKGKLSAKLTDMSEERRDELVALIS